MPTSPTTVQRRLFGYGILRSPATGDWILGAGGKILRGSGPDLLRTRLTNRLLSDKNGFYHRPGEGIGANEFRGKALTLQVRRELLNRLDSFRKDPAVLDVTNKNVSSEQSESGVRYILLSCTILTREGESDQVFQVPA